ncbi:MAG TPA: glycosyl hydrolase, partial [Dinghuibacter sp.]|uniref:glycosyl hydrolase n=1 Tax=Dinghuibacter sp. TaxID=2024697 RepID=UPI002CB38EF8
MRFFLLICAALTCQLAAAQTARLKPGFAHPGDAYKPGVYWYFMDGNMNAESITKDLEAMKIAGISHVLFLEVNVGVPRGRVDFFSPEWLRLFAHATQECKRLGIVMTLGIGPGWTGSGGPWVKGSQSMQHLVASETLVSKGQQAKLPIPAPRKPFFGEDGLPEEFKKARQDFYQDVAVLAIPATTTQKIAHSDEKALYYRAPYSSAAVPPNIPDTPETAPPVSEVLDLTGKMDPDGTLHWTPPKGDWIVLRFGARNNGAITRPAPVPGLGFECDKFDTTALYAHLDAYVGKILKNSAPGVIQRLHIDSWEAGPQNWTERFRQEFRQRRGYDPQPYYPVYLGYAVGSDDKSARFLWDLRQTAQELILENHARAVRTYAHRHDMQLSLEPYDMNPTSDLELGSVADVPMAEFWSKGYGYNTAFSVIEATSAGHIEGHALIQSESFTAGGEEAWKQNPSSMKNQGDWALASGINLFFFHTFQNQFMPDSDKPGATMGPYGVHWDRSQTWWPMVGAYHTYLSRCGYLLRQGRTVADILYLTPEGSPNVFVPPVSALKGVDTIADRRGFNFDGCAPGELMKATVRDGRIVFPSGATYKILVLPAVSSMTPRLTAKIASLSDAGATIIGTAPLRSPSLTDYPHCDAVVRALGRRLKLIPPGPLDGQFYPYYDAVKTVLEQKGLTEDFTTDAPLRYTHRTGPGWDIYFVSNTS